MPTIKFHGNGEWYNPCAANIWVYKFGAWRQVVDGVRFYYNGEWHVIDCTDPITGGWIEGDYECEQLPYEGEWVEDTSICEIDPYTGQWIENTFECETE